MSQFDALSLNVEKPFRVLLLKPDGSAWVDDAGASAYIDVLSTESDKNGEASRELADRRMKGETFSPEEEMRIRLPYLVCGWLLLGFDGKTVSDTYSFGAAKDLFAGRARDFITRQVVTGAFTLANFMPALTSA